MIQCITHHYDCYDDSHLWGPTNTGSVWCGSAAPVDPEGHNKVFCWPHHCAIVTTTSVPDAFSCIYQLCSVSSAGKFLFQSWSYHWFICYMLVDVMLFDFCFQVSMWLPCPPVGDQPLGCITATLWSITLAGICASWWWPMSGVNPVAAPPTASSRGSFMQLI